MMSKCFQELYFYFQQCLSGLCTEIIRQSTHKISKRNINNSTMMIKSLRYIGTVKCTKCKSDRPTLIKKKSSFSRQQYAMFRCLRHHAYQQCQSTSIDCSSLAQRTTMVRCASRSCDIRPGHAHLRRKTSLTVCGVHNRHVLAVNK